MLLSDATDSNFTPREHAVALTLLGSSSIAVAHEGIQSHDAALLVLKHLIISDIDKGLGKVVVDLSLQVGTTPLTLFGLNTRGIFSN